MLIQDIVRRVRSIAGDTSGLQFDNYTLTDWINDAIRECVTENSLLQVRASTTTDVDVDEYTLPPDLFKIHSVWVENEKLRSSTLEEYEQWFLNREPVPGCPKNYYIYAGKMHLYPVPDQQFSFILNYSKNPTEISYVSGGDSDAWSPNDSGLPTAFDLRIVTYCLAQVALQDEDNYKYTMLMEQFSSGVIDLKHLKDQEEDLYPFITVSERDAGEYPVGNYYHF